MFLTSLWSSDVNIMTSLLTLFPGMLAQVAQGFGLLLGTVCMNPKTAQTIASIVVLAFTLVGGYFVRGEAHSPTHSSKLCAACLQRLLRLVPSVETSPRHCLGQMNFMPWPYLDMHIIM